MEQKELTPREIIIELDNFIIGQQKAKKYVSLALRNRWRRLQVPEDLRDEITPKNIIMIGPTGVGKTEIARRISKLVQAPFIKVEASKYTEVGYVGRDVESMVRDLTEIGMSMAKSEKMEDVKENAKKNAELRVLDKLLPPSPEEGSDKNTDTEEKDSQKIDPLRDDSSTRKTFLDMIKKGQMDDRIIEVNIDEPLVGPRMEVFPLGKEDNFDMNIGSIMSKFMPKRQKPKSMSVKDALKHFEVEEAEKLVDMEEVQTEAIRKVEMNGIIFLDEIDKIAVRSDGASGGSDISREGVQRDLLPIVEGSTVSTKYGAVNTDHILFIAAGAFHVSKPSDLIPELQGRFPIRVELDALSKNDFVRILTEPNNSLVRQYKELLKTEGIKLVFNKDSIDLIAELAFEVNSKMENIGARRLYTIMEKLLEDISFEAPEMKKKAVTLTQKYVNDKLSDIIKDQDLSRYIL